MARALGLVAQLRRRRDRRRPAAPRRVFVRRARSRSTRRGRCGGRAARRRPGTGRAAVAVDGRRTPSATRASGEPVRHRRRLVHADRLRRLRPRVDAGHRRGAARRRRHRPREHRRRVARQRRAASSSSFAPNAIVDGPGPDFIVFENPFASAGSSTDLFAEPGEVSVSDDGTTWQTFPCIADVRRLGDRRHGVGAALRLVRRVARRLLDARERHLAVRSGRGAAATPSTSPTSA